MSVPTHFSWRWEAEAKLDASEFCVRVLCRDDVPPHEHLLDLQPLVGNPALWHIIKTEPEHSPAVPFQATLTTFSFDSVANRDSYTLRDSVGKQCGITLDSPLRRRLFVWRANGTLDMLVFWNWYQDGLLRIQYGGNAIVPALALVVDGSESSCSATDLACAFERGLLPDEVARP